MITKRYLTGGINGTTHAYNDTTALVGYTTAFDRVGNKLYERHLESEDRSHLYQPFNSDGSFAVGYDSANRLLQYKRGVLSSATIPYRVNPGASIATLTTLPGANQVRTYGLDGLGNWKTSNSKVVNSDESTTSTAETRAHNYVNEITSKTDTTDDTPATTPFVYDKNGNLLNDGVRIYQYDALNRLVNVSDALTSALLATYAYDGLGRRIQKTIADLGEGMGGLTGDIPAGTINYLYNGQQMAMERDDDGGWMQAYFWGRYIDELLFFAVPTETVPTTYRVLSDLLYRSVAIVTTSNVVTEAYDTDAYGNTLCYSGPGTDDLWFTDDDVTTNNPVNTTIFTGRLYDPESQIYYYRARYYSPNIGRFISRDPLPNAFRNQGPNLYRYVLNNPVVLLDSRGLCSQKDCREVSEEVSAQLYDVLGGSVKLSISGEKCSCCGCDGNSLDVGVMLSFNFGLGFADQITVGGYKVGFHALGPQISQNEQAHYVKDCGENGGSVHVDQSEVININIDIGGGIGIAGISGSIGGSVNLEFGIEGDSTGVDGYVSVGYDATAAGVVSVGALNVTFTHHFTQNSVKVSTPKINW